jgi:hypothetical protein
MRTLEDIVKYKNQALDALSRDHPYYDEIIDLLTDQILDDIHDCSPFT